MDLPVGAAYGDDMETVRRVVLHAVDDCPYRDPEREIDFYFTEFGASSINFEVRVWLTDSSQAAHLCARSEAMIAIKRAFGREGITIPFPIRTLDFGSDAVGGKRLDDMHLPGVSSPRPREAASSSDGPAMQISPGIEHGSRRAEN